MNRFQTTLALTFCLLLLAPASALAATTIPHANRHAYAVNLGLWNWRGDTNAGGHIQPLTLPRT